MGCATENTSGYALQQWSKTHSMLRNCSSQLK